jgi:hypothetical protein
MRLLQCPAASEPRLQPLVRSLIPLDHFRALGMDVVQAQVLGHVGEGPGEHDTSKPC